MMFLHPRFGMPIEHQDASHVPNGLHMLKQFPKCYVGIPAGGNYMRVHDYGRQFIEIERTAELRVKRTVGHAGARAITRCIPPRDRHVVSKSGLNVFTESQVRPSPVKCPIMVSQPVNGSIKAL